MREYFEHCGDFYRYLRAPRKTLVLILCTMRSGSTLLKAMLGTAPDVSRLSEVQFHQLRTNKFDFYNQFASVAPEPIIVLKHPVWFTDSIGGFAVPTLSRIRVISLVRDCYPTLCSIKAMPGCGERSNHDLIAYWLRCTSHIVTKYGEAGAHGRCVRYEDLIADPVGVSLDLFQFIGSKMRKGVKEYVAPASGDWRWGGDDGSDKIRSRVVQPARALAHAPALMTLIESNPRVAELRARLGYDARD